jgi:hypothetical protein
MKSDIRTFVLPTAAAASQRPRLTTQPNRNQLRFRFKTPHLFLLLGLIAPSTASPEPNGGFGFGGTTFVARNFSQPGRANAHRGRTTPRPLTPSS